MVNATDPVARAPSFIIFNFQFSINHFLSFHARHYNALHKVALSQEENNQRR